MVITGEYKFPPRIRLDTGEELLRLCRAAALTPAMAVNHYQKRQPASLTKGGRKKETGSGEEVVLERTIRGYIEQVNEHLTALAIPLHLSLVRRDDGFELEIYDMANSAACHLIRDRELGLEELPAFILSLQEEVGLLVDRKV